MARLAIDIGGTFTDLALEVGETLTTAKVLTTPKAPERGVMEGVGKVLEQSGVAPAAVRLVIHGTTLATNAIIERRGARTALLTTAGHRDALEMAHENRFEQYDIGVDRPAPLVPRYLRLGVEERLDRAGRVLIPLDEDSVRRALPVLDRYDVEAVAVGLIHSYANPGHERRVRDLLLHARPSLSVTLSAEVCPEVREYERLSTACANAYVQPLMSRYLHSLAEGLRDAGLVCPFLLMTSGGGLTTVETAAAFPVRLVESGPAGGAILAGHVAGECGLDSVLSFDMGGTTAKLCVIDGGRPSSSRHFEVARSYRFKKGSGLPVRVPVIEMVEIGAGGGSLASVDGLGRIQVGPRSAGSDPGPAAYGLGGTEPTVSDADLVLGRLDADDFAGGTLTLDPGRAHAAIREHVGRVLDLEDGTAAYGISEIVDENMANAARTHAIEFGKDVAGRALVAFGGSAPIHAARMAEKLDLDRVVVPPHAGVGSAVGFLLAPISYEVVRSRYMRLSTLDPDAVVEVLAEMREEAASVVEQGAPGAPTTERARAFMRYVGQGHEIGVEVPADLSQEEGRDRFAEAFNEAYAAVYGRTIPGLDVEILSWTLEITTEEAGRQVGVADGGSSRSPSATPVRPPAPSGTAQLMDGTSGRPVTAAVYRRGALGPGAALAGPAIVVEPQTSTVVPSGFQAHVEAGGHLVLIRRRP